MFYICVCVCVCVLFLIRLTGCAGTACWLSLFERNSSSSMHFLRTPCYSFICWTSLYCYWLWTLNNFTFGGNLAHLSTCTRPNHLLNSYEMQCKRSSHKGTTIISSSKGSAVSVILGWGCKSNLPYWLMDLVTHDAVDYRIMSSLYKVVNETLPIFCAFFMLFR